MNQRNNRQLIRDNIAGKSACGPRESRFLLFLAFFVKQAVN